MDETAIITIRIQGLFEGDFEIPRNVRCEKWLPVIEQYLKSEGVESGEILSLRYEGITIGESVTLKSLGIWDGSIIEGEWR